MASAGQKAYSFPANSPGTLPLDTLDMILVEIMLRLVSLYYLLKNSSFTVKLC